jgi:hypothetical protein
MLAALQGIDTTASAFGVSVGGFSIVDNQIPRASRRRGEFAATSKTGFIMMQSET